MEEDKSKEKDKKEIILSYQKKVDYLNTKKGVSEKEVYDAFRDFMKKYYEIEYEFNAKELEQELQKTFVPENLKKSYLKINETIDKIEVFDDKVTEKELKETVKEMKSSYQLLAKHKEDKGFLKKIFSKD